MIRVLIAKVGLDGHDRGAKVVARCLRDAGMDVIYTGLHRTPDEVVTAAVQEDVDILGVSILSGAHMTILPRIVELLRTAGAEDMIVVAGGVIPDEDVPALRDMGVAKIILPARIPKHSNSPRRVPRALSATRMMPCRSRVNSMTPCSRNTRARRRVKAMSIWTIRPEPRHGRQEVAGGGLPHLTRAAEEPDWLIAGRVRRYPTRPKRNELEGGGDAANGTQGLGKFEMFLPALGLAVLRIFDFDPARCFGGIGVFRDQSNRKPGVPIL